MNETRALKNSKSQYKIGVGNLNNKIRFKNQMILKRENERLIYRTNYALTESAYQPEMDDKVAMHIHRH